MYNWKRVGQRVKKVRENGGSVPVGSEGSVTGVGPYVDGAEVACPSCGRITAYGDADFFIAYDGVRCSVDSCVVGDWDDVEPIIPDSYKVVEWSECVWMPSHLKDASPV